VWYRLLDDSLMCNRRRRRCYCSLCIFVKYNCIFFFLYTDKPVFLNHMQGDPVDLYVFQTDSVNLSCQNSAEPAANMTWTFNGKLFTNPADHYLVRIILHNPMIVYYYRLYGARDEKSIIFVVSECTRGNVFVGAVS